MTAPPEFEPEPDVEVDPDVVDRLATEHNISHDDAASIIRLAEVRKRRDALRAAEEKMAKPIPTTKEEYEEIKDEEEHRRQEPNLINAADIAMERTTYLWKPYLPYGGATMLDGDPGIGKSNLLLTIGALASRGGPLPGSDDRIAPVRTLCINAEDSNSKTIVPRFVAAGGDVDLLTLMVEPVDPETKLVKGSVRFPENIVMLERAIKKSRARIVIIDPINSYMSPTVNTNVDSDVRRVMGPLNSLAQKLDVLIVCVRHLKKDSSESNILYMGTGSIGYIGNVRNGLMVLQPSRFGEGDNEDEYAMVHAKSNLAKKGPTWMYRIDTEWLPNPDPDDEDFEIPVIKWQGTNEDMTAAAFGSRKPKDTAIGFAEAYVLAALKDGPRTSKELIEGAKANDISKSTLRRARESLGVTADQISGFGYVSYLPGQDPEDVKNTDDEDGEEFWEADEW